MISFGSRSHQICFIIQNMWCFARLMMLRYYLQFKKYKKHPWRSVTLSEVTLKITNSSMGVFTFFIYCTYRRWMFSTLRTSWLDVTYELTFYWCNVFQRHPYWSKRLWWVKQYIKRRLKERAIYVCYCVLYKKCSNKHSQDSDLFISHENIFLCWSL